MSNLGRWDSWYSRLKADAPGAFLYGDTVTYKMAADFLSPCKTVEDWGCGAGGFKRFRPDVVGVDGSLSPYASVVQDLRFRRSSVDGILLRHVLEHDYNWTEILDAALASADLALCLVLFTPLDGSGEIPSSRARNASAGVDVPDLSFAPTEIETRLRNARVSSWNLISEIPTATQYGAESVYFVSR